MKSRSLAHAFAIALTLASVDTSALPITATGGSGLPGKQAVVTLNDGLTNALEAITVLIDFDDTRLGYGFSVVGMLFPGGTITSENPIAAGRVILGVSSGGTTSNGESGSLVAVHFDILANALAGLAAVNFRCIPDDPEKPVDAVSAQTTATELSGPNGLCTADYAIPFTASGIDVRSAAAAQAPIASTISLALLGLSLMGWCMRRGRCR